MRQPKLEEFGLGSGAHATDPVVQARDAGHKDGFEEGYSSGWEDAQKSMQEKREAVSEELARAVRDAHLTSTDALAVARQEALSLIDALLEKIFVPVLPETQSLLVRQQITDSVNRGLSGRMTLSANAGTLDTLMTISGKSTLDDLIINTEDSMADDQIVFGLGTEEALIDLKSLLQHLRSEIQAEIDVAPAAEVQDV